MTKEKFYQMCQQKIDQALQNAYAKGFCKALDEGLSLDEACDRGDLEILEVTRLMYEDDFSYEDEWLEV